MNKNNPNTHLLLTGAGFTSNFGGFLSRGLWDRLFNKVSGNKDLRELLYREQSFETAYASALSGPYPSEAKSEMAAAILAVFKELDDIVRNWNWNPGSAYPVNEYRIRRLIDRFSGVRNQSSGFFFTLNQDLFVERMYYPDPRVVRLELPGIQNPSRLPLFEPHFRTAQVEEQDFLVVPQEEFAESDLPNRVGFYYVKLHGSFGWKSTDGVLPMVIGQGKGDAIRGSGLLSWYFRTFEAAISAGNRRLLILGYGFGDAHINSVIDKAAMETGLEVAIMTRDRGKLLHTLQERDDCKGILMGLRYIYDRPLREMFPGDPSLSTTALDEMFQKEFFGSVIY
jgi:SIR2-like protein